MAYNTGNPVGSNDFRDLSDNAVNFDKYSVGADPTYPNRLGVLKLSIEGMNQEFNNAQDGRAAAFSAFLEASGYYPLGDYAAGLTFSTRTQYTVRDGVLYRVAHATTLPYTTTGNWALESSKFVAFYTEELLKQDLNNSSDLTLGGNLVARSVVVLESISQLLTAPHNANVLVNVKSYHAGANRGGGRHRYWDAGRAKSEHNGGTVIDPGRPFPADWSVLADVQAWFTAASTGTGCWVMEENGGVFLPTEFGAKADGSTNNQPMYAACAVAGGPGAKIVFTPTSQSYKMHWFFGYDNQHVIASGARIDLFKLTGGPTVLAAAGNNSRYTGLYLNCLETNLPNVRCSLENRKNTYWEFCSIVGFRDAAVPNENNGWGIYCKTDCDNHIFYQCYFYNNSQNDVAILEGSTNIQLIGCYGPNLNINIEPNSDTPSIRGITLRGMTINRLLMQENSLTGNSVNDVLVENCDVVNFFYDGVGVRFVGSRIQFLFGMPDTAGRCYAGALDLGGAIGFGPNLLRDPNMVSVSATDTGSTWQIYTGSIVPASRYAGVTYPNGRGLRFNPTETSGTAVAKGELIPVTQAYTYAVVALGSAKYPVGADSIGQHVAIRWLNSGGNEISVTIVPTNRGAAGTTTATSLEIGIVKAPTGAVNAQYLAGNTVSAATTASATFHSVGLHLMTSLYSGNGMNDPFSSHKLINGPIKGYAVTTVPTSSPNQYYYRDLLPGDEILAVTPAAGAYRGGINVVAGAPGTMKGNGLIQA